MAVAWTVSAHAQERVAALGEVVVSGSRSEQNKDDLPATVEVINSQQIEERQIRDIRDVARDLPNVSVRRAPARFGLAGGNTATGRDGNAGFGIRGLDGNRVLLLTDGIRQPRSYAFGANAFGRDLFDIGLVERIEIVKGPASALYGSDGIAGLVNFITYEPAAFLRDGQTFGGRASIGYSGDDNGVYGGVTLAGKANDALQWLISSGAGRSRELENRGTNNAANIDRTKPNPENDRGNSLLAKVILTPNADQKHSFTFEHVEKKADYNLLSNIAKPPYASTSTIGSNGAMARERNRLTWDGRFRVDGALADSLQAVVSYQKAGSSQYEFQDRFTALDRVRNSVYDDTTWQLGLQANKRIDMGSGWLQKLSYGFDYVRTQVESNDTGVVSPLTGAPGPYTVKYFPDTRETTSALYVQDEFVSDRWSITPGVRVDRFSLDARQAGFSGTAASLSGSAVSPKLGVLFRATPQWSVYGSYAAGFRAPNAFEVNKYFENLAQGYRTIPNPNLKPEKSQNFELGVRGRLDALAFDAAAFTGDYKNFIENDQVVSGSFGNPRNPAIIQTVNIGRARISGFEFRGEWTLPVAGSGVFSVPFAYGQARGTNRTTGQPINSVDPRKASIGLKYQAPAWGVRLDAVYHAAKKLSDIDRTVLAGAYYAIPAATTLDLSAQWRISKTLRLHAAIVNLTNKKYWLWSDVRGGAVTAANIDAFSQPGRHVNVSLVADF